MRLINAQTLDLHDFVDSTVPPYAILSHTWEDGEVSFQDWQRERLKQDEKRLCEEGHSTASPDKHGFVKIRNVCEQARRVGINYVWVDTNCIDKSSSAELSEAINSMFAWYERAEICFVYLSDVPAPGDDEQDSQAASIPPSPPLSRRKTSLKRHSSLSKARWFTRGWTLQELLAPRQLVFMSKDWREIGRIDKTELILRNLERQGFIDTISSATGIGRPYLLGIKSRFEASTALRMSWAASRKTTRVEDKAYCLLGLFNINMPLLYGEGHKAFIRLQQEIMKVSTDQSIFAWEWTKDVVVSEGEVSFIAPSPSCFARSGDFVELEDRGRSMAASTYILTNTGLSLRLSIHQMPRTGLAFALLECSHRFYSKIDQYRLCIPVRLGPQTAADRVQMCERLSWPPLPLCIAFFSPELHQLHIPRKAPRPHLNFEGLPAEFLHRDQTSPQQRGCTILLLFPPSKHPYTVKGMRPYYRRGSDPLTPKPSDGAIMSLSSSRASIRTLKFDSIGMFEFRSWWTTPEYDFVGLVVEVALGERSVWIHLKVAQDEHFIFKACSIVKTRRNQYHDKLHLPRFFSSTFATARSGSDRSGSSTKNGNVNDTVVDTASNSQYQQRQPPAPSPALTSTPSSRWPRRNRRYTIQDAISILERRRSTASVWWDKQMQGNWLVEMGTHAVDSTGAVTVPVYVNYKRAVRGEPGRTGEVDFFEIVNRRKGGNGSSLPSSAAFKLRSLLEDVGEWTVHHILGLEIELDRGRGARGWGGLRRGEKTRRVENEHGIGQLK